MESTPVDTSRQAVERRADLLDARECCMTVGGPGTHSTAVILRALLARAEQAESEKDDLDATFRMRWDADMRAITRWAEAHPERQLTWPDRADLVVWLLNEQEQVRREAREEAAKIALELRDAWRNPDQRQGVAFAEAIAAAIRNNHQKRSGP